MVELIYGGSGSGKSAYAEGQVMKLNNTWKYYVATMQVYDEEGRAKVERHRKLRAGKGFVTIEKNVNVGELAECRNEINLKLRVKDSCVLLECLSNLLANEMFCADGTVKEETVVVEKIIEEILKLSQSVENLVIVSNNIFEDGIEYDESTRKYMRALGALNCKLAEMAGKVVEVVAGIPVTVKQEIR